MLAQAWDGLPSEAGEFGAGEVDVFEVGTGDVSFDGARFSGNARFDMAGTEVEIAFRPTVFGYGLEGSAMTRTMV
ncbi:hypothetical protein [Nocardia sp. CA-119907]|uniref:hypothetical protein n=1 Tax=Nocardia sp. CA-119907 TaxID=3239973 RepID=UPI003D97E66A